MSTPPSSNNNQKNSRDNKERSDKRVNQKPSKNNNTNNNNNRYVKKSPHHTNNTTTSPPPSLIQQPSIHTPPTPSSTIIDSNTLYDDHSLPFDLGSSFQFNPSSSPSSLDNTTTTTTNTTTSNIIIGEHDIAQSVQQHQKGRPCVVGVIGDSSQGKFLFLNKLINSSEFHKINQPTTILSNGLPSSDESIKLEIYHDESKDNVYINLNSIRDTRLLANICDSMVLENVSSNDLEKWFDEADYMHLKYLLFMFNICNIIFLVFENLTIKLEYFNIFKTLKYIKQMTMPSINNILLKQNIPADLMPFLTPGRCVPILQVFLVKNLTDNNNNYSRDFHLKIEESLKKQILTLLKNNSLFTSFSSFVSKKDSSSPLFLIELNRPLVRLIRLYQMYNHTTNELFDDKSKALTVQKHFRFYSQLINVYENGYHNIPSACINSYKYTISNLKYKLPEYAVWEKTVQSLSSFFEQKESVLSNIKNFIGVDLQFSSKNCQNYYKSAVEQYLDSLPPIYGSKIHQSKLQKAIKTLTFYASGPAIDQYINNLKQECEAIWRKGRKLCEAESVTGRLCTLKTHHLPGAEKDSSITTNGRSGNTEIETRPHSSGYRSMATCNCGKTIKLREDVFDLEMANSLFYQQDCCSLNGNTSIELPNTIALYHSPITYQQRNYTSPFSWFSLIKYFKSQDGVLPNEVNNDDAVAGNLQDWDIKRILTIWHNNQNKDNKDNKCEIGKMSYEYQCPVGHRFYEKRRSRKFFIDSCTSNEIKVFYQKQLMENCTHSDCDYLAQLTRVILLPSIDISALPIIEIKHNDKLSSKWEFTLDNNINLLNHTLYSLRLPYAYLFDSINVMRNPQASTLLSIYFIINTNHNNN